MILALDIGNSRAKWAVFDRTPIPLQHGVCATESLPELVECLHDWRGLPVIISNVAGAKAAADAALLCQRLHLQPAWVEARPVQCGVRNGYANPAQLGADRWAALVAARQRVVGPCVVAVAGTALTIDMLTADGLFIGGVIVPGVRLMRQALTNGTARLPDAGGDGRWPPDNTADALYAGAQVALTGAVIEVKTRLMQHTGTMPHCLVSGGDATWLATTLPVPVDVAEFLVLEGLFWIGHDLLG